MTGSRMFLRSQKIRRTLRTKKKSWYFFLISLPYFNFFFLSQTEEDKTLKEKLDLLTERLRDRDPEQQVHALTQMKIEISGATSSMTSVPKPLKFLREHYQGIKEHYNTLEKSKFKVKNIQKIHKNKD
jgi:hypothetical protein